MKISMRRARACKASHPTNTEDKKTHSGTVRFQFHDDGGRFIRGRPSSSTSLATCRMSRASCSFRISIVARDTEVTVLVLISAFCRLVLASVLDFSAHSIFPCTTSIDMEFGPNYSQVSCLALMPTTKLSPLRRRSSMNSKLSSYVSVRSLRLLSILEAIQTASLTRDGRSD